MSATLKVGKVVFFYFMFFKVVGEGVPVFNLQRK